MIQKKITSNYWNNKLKSLHFIDFPTTTYSISSVKSITIKSNELNYFYKLTSGNSIAEFTIFLTIFNALIQRYFEKCDSILSGSHIYEQQALLLYSFSSIDNKTLKQFLQEVKEEVQDVYRHRDYDLVSLKELELEKYTPFGFSYNSSKDISSPFFLKIFKQENGDIKISMNFSENFCKKDLVEHFLNRIGEWVFGLEENIERQISQILIVSKAEKENLLSKIGKPGNSNSLFETIISLFHSQVLKTPGNIALEYGEKKLTYAMLNEQSNQFAFYLLENTGVSQGDFVGVKLGRSEKLLISLLGVLKAGATYVPIDVNYPDQRIGYIENDSNCKLVIDDKEFRVFEGGSDNYPKDNIQNCKNSRDLAYIIYTSGTTGNPKGVMINHNNAVALINWAKEEFKGTDFDVVYAATSHCFDLSVFEFFYTLSVGKRIKLLDSALEISKHLENDSKVLLNTVPSIIRSLLKEGCDLSSISAVNLAGEPFPVDIAKRLLTTEAEIRNLYGPSEDTTYSTCYRLSHTKGLKSIPIGQPIANTQVYILDGHMQLLPPGAIGKLHVSGAGVAQGYLNRPELTAKNFLENPYFKGERIYDTGDLARWLPDGNIEFLGRKDSQVKLRGYRIELGEIENSITEFSEDILQAVVDIKTVEKEDILIGYYVEKRVLDKSQLRTYLQKKLPSYMIPTYFSRLAFIPLTPNGKVDKKALSEIKNSNIIRNDYVAPRNKIEQDLATIWEEILGLDQVGITDNFFELGGHSLKINTLLNRISVKYNTVIKIEQFFSSPTIEFMSLHIENVQWENGDDKQINKKRIII